MVQQSLPTSHQNTTSIRQPHPLHTRQPTRTYDVNCHCPLTPVPIPTTSRTSPMDKQGPPAIHSLPYSSGPSLRCRECLPLCTFLETLIHTLYLCFLLGLPLLYTSRVTIMSKQVDTNMAEIKKSVLEMSTQAQPDDQIFGFSDSTSFNPHDAPQLYKNLKHAWDSFIDSLMRDWRMLNVISTLILSAIVAILQIQSAADDPFTRFSGLLSLICVFISVSYGCMYSIQFDSMREIRKAVEWTLEAQNTKTSKFWNVHTLLAMPLIWLAWSMLLYLICFLCFVWRTGTTTSTQSPPTVTAHDILGPRLVISAIITLGIACFVLIFNTFRRYGNVTDDAWNLRVKGWLLEAEFRADQQGRRQTN